ncbi:MAG: IPT/TIG domain-containing protein [Terriglobales bacterium]
MQINAIYYDAATGDVFAADYLHNRISVLSSQNDHLIASISVPSPLGMGAAPSGGALYVGSATGAFFVVNTSTLHLMRRVALPSALSPAGVPQQPSVMADGSVIWALGTPLNPGNVYMSPNVLVRWHPDTGLFDAPFSSPNPNLAGYAGMPVLVNGGQDLLLNAGTLYLYSEQSRTVVASSPAFMGSNLPASVAASPDGSQYLLTFEQYGNPNNASYEFLDSALQPEGSVTTAPAPLGLAGPVMALYSPAGKTAYLTDDGTVAALNPTTRSINGYFQISFASLGSFPLLWNVAFEDGGGNFWGTGAGGVFKAAIQLSPQLPAFRFTQNAPPSSTDTGPVGGGTAVEFGGVALTTPDSDGILSSMQVYFGGLAGLDQAVQTIYGANTLSATTPPAVGPGPVTVLLTDASGNPTFLPYAFTYGPNLSNAAPQLLSPQGGDAMSLIGNGFGEGAKINAYITVAGKPANVTSVGSASLDFDSSVINFLSPPGEPGWVPVTLATANGTETLADGALYAQQSVTLKNPGYSSAAYDPTRDVFYLSGPVIPLIGGPDQIGVFDPKTSTWGTPLSLANPACANGYGPPAVSPDGNYLVAACGSGVAVFNLNAPGSGQYVSMVLPGDPDLKPWIGSLAISSQDQAFVNLGSDYCPAEGPVPLRELDLATLSLTTRSDNAPACAQGSAASASGDGSTLLFSTTSPLQSQFWRYDTATDTLTGPVNSSGAGPLSLDGDGSVLEAGGQIVNAQLQPLAPVFNGQGVLNQSGSLTYSASGIADSHNGQELLSLGPQNAPTSAGGVAISPAGNEILVVSTGTISFWQLAVVPLAVGTVTPDSDPAGTEITVRGSGFEDGITAKLAGTAMSCAVSDAQDMSCTIPNGLPAGAAPMTLTDPDGQTYSFELAFALQ